jgi:SAM-dependent methyltransferase
VLTVRYDRLGVRRGDRLLDVGTGGGRHAFEALRWGATVTAIDVDAVNLKDVAAMMAGVLAEESGPAAGSGTGTAIAGDARELPFASEAFDRVIAAEVLEHVPEDRIAMGELVRVLRPGGTIAVTVPRWGPELILWGLSDEYHRVPGGHVRIYRRSSLVSRLRAAGLDCYGSHHAHALHSPYWWLRAAVGVSNETHPLVQAYHRILVWDIVARPPVTRLPDAVLNPLIGKSLVIYARKPR